MKRILTALVLLTGLLGAGGAVWAGDFEKCRKRYIDGFLQWPTFKECKPLAEQGDAYAQYRLGELYENGGRGVLQDRVAAHMWFNIAVANGKGEAFVDRDQLGRKLSSSQVAEAEKRAKRCMESKYKDCEAEPKSWWQKLLD